MNSSGVEWLGWLATAVFVGSYFFARPSWLRVAQIIGAALWIIYGIMIHAMPVIVANILVMSAAAWTSIRGTATAAPAMEP